MSERISWPSVSSSLAVPLALAALIPMSRSTRSYQCLVPLAHTNVSFHSLIPMSRSTRSYQCLVPLERLHVSQNAASAVAGQVVDVQQTTKVVRFVLKAACEEARAGDFDGLAGLVDTGN